MIQYKDLLKSFRKERRSYYLNVIKNRINRVNPYYKIKYKYLTQKNKAPDVSTITEHIAFVIDGQVVEIIHCQPKMAAILLSEPEIVKIPDGLVIRTGWSYIDGEFSVQEQQPQQQQQPDDELPTFKDYFHEVKNDIPHLPKPLSFKEFIENLKERV